MACRKWQWDLWRRLCAEGACFRWVAQQPETGPLRAPAGASSLATALENRQKATCFNLLPNRTRFRFRCQISRQLPKGGCRPSASLMRLIRGPGGRHVSTIAAHCVSRFDSFGMRALLRRRLELLPFRSLHLTGAGLLWRRKLLLGAALLFGAQVLPTSATLLFAALLPTRPSLLLFTTAGGLSVLSESGQLGRPLSGWLG